MIEPARTDLPATAAPPSFDRFEAYSPEEAVQLLLRRVEADPPKPAHFREVMVAVRSGTVAEGEPLKLEQNATAAVLIEGLWRQISGWVERSPDRCGIKTQWDDLEAIPASRFVDSLRTRAEREDYVRQIGERM